MSHVFQKVSLTLSLIFLTMAAEQAPTRALAGDIVLYSSDVTVVRGNWAKTASASAAGAQMLSNPNLGWSSTSAPLAAPTDYFEATFSAPAATIYHVWLRLRASNDSKWNDSVWVQFSDSTDASGAAANRIGSGAGIAVNLENCSGCGVSGWGWQDRAYWLAPSLVAFTGSGTHTIRVQTREDGANVDQIVLSPATYLASAPGAVVNDSTIVPKASSSPSSTPFYGSAQSIPGTITAADFDAGGEGVAYHDTTVGNAGGAYRATDVDLEPMSGGGTNVGWIAPGEWLNYTVTVAGAGAYTVTFRVASSGAGGSFHLEMGGSNVSGAMTIPNTGGWQAWQTLTKSVTLSGGTQIARLVFDSAGSSGAVGNISTLQFATSTSGGSGGPTPYSGTAVQLPGTIQAANFDNGGEGVAYHDTTDGNAGGGYRQTDVDIESSVEGGYDVGWIAAGEWLNYSVNATSAGSYTAQLRVASPNGGALRLAFGSPSSVSTSVSIPATGNWQSWTTVSVPVTLGAGLQMMTLMFDTSGFNVSSVQVAAVGGSPPPPPPPPTGGNGVVVTMANWNVQIDDSSAYHAQVAMDLMMSLGPRPQIVLVQEGHRSQFDTYINELQSQSGLRWYGAFQTHCPPGAWNGSSCTGSEDEGVGIFSSYPITDSSSLYLPYADAYHSARAIVRAAVNVNGTIVQLFSVHLQPNNATARYASMSLFKQWASNYSRPQLLGGDFNAGPDQIDTSQGIGDAFVDAWSVAGSGNGYTAFLPNPSMKIDFSFSDVGGKAPALSTEVVTTTGTWSDHAPVLTTFVVYP